MSSFVLGLAYCLTERLAWKRPAFLGASRAHRQQYPTGSGALSILGRKKVLVTAQCELMGILTGPGRSRKSSQTSRCRRSCLVPKSGGAPASAPEWR